ncbi:MAG: SDR family oxidoreductase [Candidatus Entotheonellia bacterium]
MRTFAGQTAVVTGASSGIGSALALGLAAQGAAVCLVGRNLERLEAVAERARATPARVLIYQADLTRDAHMHALTTRLQRDVGQLDVLVHGAGVIALGPIEDTPLEKLDWQYRTNVRAPYALTQAVLPMLRDRQGQIVFINSSVGLNARANVGQYAATKAALKAIADSLRQEVNAVGVRVLSVFLGRTASPMQAALYALEGRVYQPDLLMQPEDVAAAIMQALSLPRSVEVTDLHMRPLVKSYA